MGKRKARPTPKRGKKPSAAAAEEEKSGATNDISEDCVAYESPDEAAAAAAGPQEDDDASNEASSDDELELDAGTGATDAADDGASDIMLDLDFFDPTAGDEQAVKKFLADTAAAGGVDAEALAEAICAQSRVGTVIKADEVHAGVISALAAADHRPLFKTLLKRLRKEGAPDNVLRAFEEPEDDKPVGSRVGVVFTGGVLNLPVELAPKMFEALLCEVEWATADEPTPELRKSFDLHWFLYFADYYPVPQGAAAKDAKEPPRKKKKADDDDGADSETPFSGFTRIEDEILFSKASHNVTLAIPDEKPQEDGVVRRKMAMFIKKDKMTLAHKAIVDYFGALLVDGGGDTETAET